MLSLEDRNKLIAMRDAAMAVLDLEMHSVKNTELNMQLQKQLHILATNAKQISFDCKTANASIPWKDIIALQKILADAQKHTCDSQPLTTSFNMKTLLLQLETILRREHTAETL